MLLGIKTLFLGLSVAITQAIYPVIPRLYNLFMFFADFEFLSNDFINDVWNNLYVLVGVVVLFAIIIKLISAMVNPDVLTDNKKGVKGTYFRAVFAVVLIFLCPLGFKLAYEVQGDLLKDNFLMSHVFGYEVRQGGIGQMLAWETFSAFCTPTDKNTGGRLDIIFTASDEALGTDIMSTYYAEYYQTEYDIDNISHLDFELFYSTIIQDTIGTIQGSVVGAPDICTAAKDAFVGFEYHAILCPLAGILVAYEMLLLCMDTIFRAAKLAVLELMLPLVLGAYVFNPEILKKWAKEFFSTYIIVFLKVLAIGFMVIAIEALKGVIF